MLRKTKTKSLSSYVITNQLSNSLYLINYVKKEKNYIIKHHCYIKAERKL